MGHVFYEPDKSSLVSVLVESLFVLVTRGFSSLVLLGLRSQGTIPLNLTLSRVLIPEGDPMNGFIIQSLKDSFLVPRRKG